MANALIDKVKTAINNSKAAQAERASTVNAIIKNGGDKVTVTKSGGNTTVSSSKGTQTVSSVPSIKSGNSLLNTSNTGSTVNAQTNPLTYQANQTIAKLNPTKIATDLQTAKDNGPTVIRTNKYYDFQNWVAKQLDWLKNGGGFYLQDDGTITQGKSNADKERDLDIQKKMGIGSKSRTGTGFKDKFGANFDIGYLTTQANLAWNDAVNNPTNENVEYANQLAELRDAVVQNNMVSASTPLNNPVLNTIAGDTAQNLPQMIGSIGRSAVPTLLSMGTGNVGLAKAAAVGASGSYSYDLMRGASFQELMENGASADVAKKASADEAKISAAIEMGEMALTLGVTTGKMLFGTGKKVSADLATQGLFKKIATESARYGGNITSETFEEGAQQIVSIANRLRIADGKGRGGIKELSQYIEEATKMYFAQTPETAWVQEEVNEAAKAGGRVAAVTGMAEIGISHAQNRFINPPVKTTTQKAENMAPEATQATKAETIPPKAETPVQGRNEQFNSKPEAEPQQNPTQNTKKEETHKEKQLKLILESHPKNPNSYQTWVETLDDIKTYDEAVKENGFDVTPDFTREDVANALRSGEVTVYSSHEIKNGTFVTPSRMIASDYAGGGEVYSAKVSLDDVAWIDNAQGQYAKVGEVVTDDLPFDMGEAPAEKPDNTAPKGAEEVLNRTTERRDEGVKELESKKPVDGIERKLEYWKGQTAETKAKTVRKTDVNKVSKMLVESSGSNITQKAVSAKLQKLGDYIVQHTGETFDNNVVTKMATEIADDIASEVYDVTVDNAEARKEFRSWFKDRPIALGQYRNDVSPDFNEWAKHYKGVFRFNEKTGEPIDTMDMPGMAKYTTGKNPADQMIELAKIWDDLKENKKWYLSDQIGKEEYAKFRDGITESVLEAVLGDDIRETAPTRADRARARIEQLKADVKAEREKGRQNVKQAKQQAREREKAQKEKTNIKKYKEQIEKSANNIETLLNKNGKEKHVVNGAKELAETLVMAKGDMVSENANVVESLDKLRNVYKSTEKSGDVAVATAYSQEVADYIDGIKERIGNKKYSELSSAELKEVAKGFKMVEHSIREADTIRIAGKKASVTESAKQVQTEIPKVKANPRKATIGQIQDIAEAFGWNNLKPVYQFESIGSKALMDIGYNEFRRAENGWANDCVEARKFYQPLEKKYNVKSWDKTATEKIGGLELTLGERMEAYIFSKRPQAAEHMANGGIVADSSLKDATGKYKNTKATATPVSEDMLQQIVDSLTDEQKAYADECQKYLSTVMAEKGNEATRELYGVDLFNDESYFHIRSAPQYIASKQETSENAQMKNAAFTKETVPHAQNPIVLGDFFNDWQKQVVDMINYHNLAVPIDNFNKVWNYAEKRNPLTGDSANSVKQAVQDAYGRHAVEAVDGLLKSMNGGVKADPSAKIMSKFIAKFKKSAVFASASVFVQQGTAVIRGMSYVDPKYWTGAGVKVGKEKHAKLWNELKEYAPIAVVKEMGYFDTNVGRTAGDYITATDYEGAGEKISAFFKDKAYRDEAFSVLPSWADEVAWVSLWEAVKNETADKTGLDINSKELLEKAGKRFEYVCERTQVYDSTLSRSQYMRSTDNAMKMATSFMAEPTTMANMLIDGAIKSARGDKKALGRTIGAVAASIVVNDLISSLVYAARDDDEDKNYFEKYAQALGDQLMDDVILGVPNMLPLIRDFVSSARGYDVERADMSIFRDIIKSYSNLTNEDVSTPEKLIDALSKTAVLFDIPLPNMLRDAKALMNVFTSSDRSPTKDSISDAFLEGFLGREFNKTENNERVWEAYASGNTERGRNLAERYIEPPEKYKVNGEDVDLTKEQKDIYTKTYVDNIDKYLKDLSNDSYFKGLSEDEQEKAKKTVFSKVGQLAEFAVKDNMGVKHGELDMNNLARYASLCAMTGDSNVSIDSMRKIIEGGLKEQNVRAYYDYTNAYDKALDEKDYGAIDNLIRKFDGMNTNIKQTVWKRDSQIKKLVNWADEHVGSKDYFAYTKSLDEISKTKDIDSSNSVAMLWALDDADIRPTTKERILDKDILGLSVTARACYDILYKDPDIGFSIGDVADFIWDSDYAYIPEREGDDIVEIAAKKSTDQIVRTLAKDIQRGDQEQTDQAVMFLLDSLLAEGVDISEIGITRDGQLKNVEVTAGLKDLGYEVTDKEAQKIYNSLKERVSNYYNNWKNYTLKSEWAYTTKKEGEGTYYGRSNPNNPLIN